MIEEGFRASCLHAVVEDVYVVPDYALLLGPCIITGNNSTILFYLLIKLSRFWYFRLRKNA
jgi:hypothetical protein